MRNRGGAGRLTRRLAGLTAAAAVSLLTMPVRAQPQRLVLAIGTALDGRGGVIHDTRLVIEDGKIARLDPAASPVDYDLRALTVTPGWIDTHVHLNWHFDEHHKSVSGREPAEQAALYTEADAWTTLHGGFTTVQSVGAAIDAPVRDRIDRRPAARTAGAHIAFVRSPASRVIPTRCARWCTRRKTTAPISSSSLRPPASALAAIKR